MPRPSNRQPPIKDSSTVSQRSVSPILSSANTCSTSFSAFCASFWRAMVSVHVFFFASFAAIRWNALPIRGKSAVRPRASSIFLSAATASCAAFPFSTIPHKASAYTLSILCRFLPPPSARGFGAGKHYLFCCEHRRACNVPFTFHHRFACGLFGSCRCLGDKLISAQLRFFHHVVADRLCSHASRSYQAFGPLCRVPDHGVALLFGLFKPLRGRFCHAHAFCNFLPPFVNNLQNRLIQKIRKRREQQSKIHRLNEKQFPIDAECCE